MFLAFIPTAALPLVLLGVPLQLAGIDIDGPLVAVLGLSVQVAVYVLLIRLVVVDTGALSLVRDANPAAVGWRRWVSWPSAQPGRCRSSSSPA